MMDFETFKGWARPLVESIQYQMELDDVVYNHTGTNMDDFLPHQRLVSPYIELLIAHAFGEAAATEYAIDVVYETLYDDGLTADSRIEVVYETLRKLV